MGLIGSQKALWVMIMASNFPACIVSLLFPHRSEISEMALVKPSTSTSTLLAMKCRVVSSAYSSRLPSVIELLKSLI